MKFHRFFLKDSVGDDKEVVVRDLNVVHQLRNVFRFTVGGQVILLDNTGLEYRAMISAIDSSSVSFSIVSQRESPSTPRREIVLFVSVLKKDKFEWVVEKGTEIGVTKFIPVISDRSEKKGLNLERIEKIAKEASEQSERAMIPTVSPPVSFVDALNQEFPCFAFDPKGDTFTVEHAQNYSPLGIFIGPEGGFTDKEIFAFKKNNIKVYSLGTQILRAETSAIVVPAIILFS